MCGIAGIAVRGNRRPLPDLGSRLALMNRAQRHRGPDGDGAYVTADNRAGIGNCRLAIRDLSPAGRMPMSNRHGTVTITYNGELYNAARLRRELETHGYDFSSSSDTEVVLHGYEHWGEDVLCRLRGIFAFAILDNRTASGTPHVFLARDRLGVKPLYYALTPDVLAFASELRGVLASGLVPACTDRAALAGYLLLGAVPDPLTIYSGIRSLEPAHLLQLGAVGTTPDIRRYWRFPDPTHSPAGDTEAAALTRDALHDAVAAQLVSDVPLGAFLSGGLDSASVVTLMRRATSGPIRTCSLTFAEPGFDESAHAASTARAAGTEHVTYRVSAAELEDELDGFMDACDQPTADGLNVYLISGAARRAGLTVALSGLGGDELFGGYPAIFRGVPSLMRMLRRVQSVPAAPRAARAVISASLYRRRLAKLSDALGRPVSAQSAYLARRGLFAPSEVRALLGREEWDEVACRSDLAAPFSVRADGAETAAPTPGSPAWLSRAELLGYTTSQLLRDTDVMSMAHSLEVRVPLLDDSLVGTVLRLPDRTRLGNRYKGLLLDAVGDLLPDAVRAPRRKQGFTLPLGPWLAGPLRGRLREMVHDGAGASGLDTDVAQDVWRAFERGRVRWTRPWALAVLANDRFFPAPAHRGAQSR